MSQTCREPPVSFSTLSGSCPAFSKGQEHMWWANVETKPYGGYPQWWDAKILKLLEDANPEGMSWDTDVAGDPEPSPPP